MRLACRPLVSSGNAKRVVIVKSMSTPRHRLAFDTNALQSI